MKFKIGCIGSPFSGKTTTSALLFAELKKKGYPVEFLPEYARVHIREKRSIDPDASVVLNDSDQLTIARGQFEWEKSIMDYSGKEVVLITDGSVSNAYFYTTTPILDLPKTINQYDLLFFSKNIERTGANDGNRIHNSDFSLQMESKIKEELEKLCPLVKRNVVVLNGSVEERLETAFNSFKERFQKK